MIKSAFHLHTMQIPPQEGVQTISPKKLLSYLYRQDIGLPIITNKNSISDVKKIREDANKLDIFVPYAVEARTKPDEKGNIVEVIAVFNGMDDDTEKVIHNADRYTHREFIEYVKSKNGKVVLPHPFQKRVGIAYLKGDKEVENLCRIDMIDGIEWNLQLDNILSRRNNMEATNFLNEINRKYGLDIPLIPGNDSYSDDIEVVMQINSGNPEEALWKLFEGKFKPIFKKPSLPRLYYALRHGYFAIRYEPKGTLDLFL